MSFGIKEKWGGRKLSPLSLVLLGGLLTEPSAMALQENNTNDQIIAYVARDTDPEAALLRRMRQYMQKNPEDFGTAISLAERYILKGKNESNTRYLGYAAAVLKRWLDMQQVATEALILDAEIKQYNHDFSGALETLKKIPQSSNQYQSAALMAANIHQIQGRFSNAQEKCRALNARMAEVSEICALSLSSMSGELDAAKIQLENRLASNAYQPEILTWALGKLVDMSIRSGRAQEALHYASLMDEELARASFHRAQLSDLLFSLNRPDDVLSLISKDETSDALLVRRLRAQKLLGENWRSKSSDRLEQLFIALEKTGRNPHAREAAYYYLHLNEDPQKALQSALENWEEQKETIDTRLVLAAAKRVGNLSAADRVMNWIIKNRYQDVTLAEFLMPGEGLDVKR